MTERLLRIKEVMQKTSLAQSTIYKLMRNDGFPGMIKIGQTSVWAESEVDEWINTMKDSRDKKHV